VDLQADTNVSAVKMETVCSSVFTPEDGECSSEKLGFPYKSTGVTNEKANTDIQRRTFLVSESKIMTVAYLIFTILSSIEVV
jgi:hypothetical protein